MRLLRSFLLVLLIGATLFFFSSCEMFNEREDCDGHVEVVNAIPDTTLSVDGPTYERDLSESPIVFQHTEEKTILYRLFNEDFIIANATVGSKSGLLKIEAKRSGTITIEVQGSDDCDKTAATTFEVTVTE